MSIKPRILFLALRHESHSFLSQDTAWEDFEVLRGEEIMDCRGDGSPTDGFLSVADESGWEVVPTLQAQCVPGGQGQDEILHRYWSELRQRMLRALSEGIGGIFVSLHGAMTTKSHLDVEGELLRQIRTIPGAANVPLFGVLDLHANVSAHMTALSNGLVCYRKNPHTDAKDAAARAARLLRRQLETHEAARMHLCRIPLLLPPPATGTQADPMLSLTRLAAEIEEEAACDGLWAFNVAAGFSFGDTPDTGVSFSIVARHDTDVRRHLERAAHLAWELRDAGIAVYPSVDRVLREAGAAPQGPVLLVEPADNIGGGALGDGTGVLRGLLANKIGNALLTINDPAAVQALRDCSRGERRRISIGGRGWKLDEGPVEADVTLVHKGGGAFRLEDPHSHLAAMSGNHFDMGPCAVVNLAGVTILLTSRKTPPFDLGQYRSQGIEPRNYSYIGVKAAVAHRHAYDPITRASYWVDTPGPCSSQMHRFPYRHLSRPIYPLDQITKPMCFFA
jgi:microcystin degradation protein MlrC